eukprot:CAMPEP_0181290110 /NCGR_PEP_ID=MMETSP1101-20121128/1243_1 /TAXON_ID=46948 /ORGANISM="Rhodomonas abbreviata, Strain Caron Lab Isolate" /LENGTH=633 /DNA_ID=CAMNT_0023394381 /DNA_START=347 /DNA_END=2244 /DNA_ORIENTATION=-
MSLPCVEGVVYRNDITEVARFFRERHYGKYKVYNLCEHHESKGNGNYDCALLYNQVQKYPFRDHNAPSLETLMNFCEDATAWLNDSPSNVVAVHCQGGKGRTGTFCSSLMLWVSHRASADESMKLFEERRRDLNRGKLPYQGVTAPSQIRYVQYVEKIVSQGTDFISKQRQLLNRLTIKGIPLRIARGCKITFIIEASGVVQYDHGKAKGLIQCPRESLEKGEWVVNVGGSGVLVSRDVAIRFFVFSQESAAIPAMHHQGYALRAPATLTDGGRTVWYDTLQGDQLFFVQFHTSFDNTELMFKKHEIDGAYNKSNTDFPEDFELHVGFSTSKGDVAKSPKHGNLSNDAGLRNIWINQMIQSVIARIQPRTLKFYKNDVIFDPQAEPEAGGRHLRFIVSGIAKQYMVGTDDTKSVINNGVSFHGDCIGSGDCDAASMICFVLGSNSARSGTVLRAWTDVVEVRELTITGKPEDMTTNLLFDGATAEESALIWESVARQLASAGKRSWVQQKESAKTAHGTTQLRARTNKLVKDTRTHFNLSANENVLGTCPAERVMEEEGTITGIQGHIIAFQNWLIFRDANVRSQDLAVSFEGINRVVASGRVLTLHLRRALVHMSKESESTAMTYQSPVRSP